MKGLASNEILCPLHGLEEERLHTLSDITVAQLEQAVLQGTTARIVNLVAKGRHPLSESCETA